MWQTSYRDNILPAFGDVTGCNIQCADGAGGAPKSKSTTYCVRTATREQSAARGSARTDHAVARTNRASSHGLGAASARWRPATDGALWSRLMNAIRRFYRSTTGPRDRAVVRSARGSAQRRIDRPPEPLNSPGQSPAPARCTTRRITCPIHRDIY